MPPQGGLADKVGNRYEGRIAVWRILQLLDERHDSIRVRFEQPGEDSFEWWVQRSDGSRTYTQVKRQHSLDAEWSIGALVSRKVIPAFGEKLRDEPDARCEFFSALSASHLKQMSDDARMAASLDEFETSFVAAKEKNKSWKALCEAWPDATHEEAWRRLQRVTAENIGEESLRDTLRARAQALVDAPPDDVIARLGDYLDDHLAEELTAHDIWSHLRESCGFRPTDWSRDKSTHARIHDETARYRDGIADDRAPLPEIQRSEAGAIADLLATPGGPTVVTVAAGAGAGKTALLGQILDSIDAKLAANPGDDCPRVILATRLDRLDGFRDAHELGRAMRLPGPPAAVLSQVAAGHPALLVLDQVDAFGAGSGRNPARLEAVTETLRDARALGIKVLIACRVFDLETDDRLANLAGITRNGQQASGHHVERLGPLSSGDVDNALRAAGIEPTTLTSSLRTLLSTPLHLHMLVVLHQRGRLDPAGISTRLQLFDKFFATVREEAEARQPNAPVTEVSDRLAVMLSERQELSVAAARLGEHQATVDSLVRAGWLRRDGGRISFAHEAFFDYAFAQQHMRSGLPLLSLLRSSEQLLFRRAQVRQILALEREQDHDQYLRDVREILAAHDIRPHLKELVVGLVTLVTDPGLDEWEALGVLGDATADSLAERACWLAAQAPGFSQLLIDRGIISAYLSDPGTASLGAWMCTLLVRNHLDDAALLRPYAGEDGWSGRLIRVLNAAPLSRSDQAVSLAIAAIDAGDLDADVRGPGPRSGDFFSLLHGIRGQSAASGARLVAAWLRRRLALLIADEAYTLPPGPAGEEPGEPGDGPDSSGADEDRTDEERVAFYIKAMHEAQSRRLLSDSMSAPEILATLAADDAVAFTRNILPVVRQASQASRTGQVTVNGERDEAFGMTPSRQPGHDPTDALLIHLAQAVRAAAASGDQDAHAAVRDMAGSALATEQLLAAAGFASGHPDLLAEAATWLQAGPYALDQGWLDDARELSAQVIAQVCGQMPAEQARQIQERAATHVSPFEKHQRDQHGAAAWRLLRDIPEGSLTSEARARKSELGRKFARPTAAISATISGVMDMSVRSPIDITAVRQMSDQNLLNAMRRWSADEWQPEPSGRLRGGASTFAQVLGSAAQEDPNRFTTVLESLPGDINPVYTTHILLGLSRAATPEQALRAARAARAHAATAGMQIGQLIERAAPHLGSELLTAAGLTEDELLEILGQLLAQPPAPPADDGNASAAECNDADPSGETGEETVQAPATDEITGEKIAERLTFRVWNRPENAALRALAILAPGFPRGAELLTRQLGLLAGSPNLAVRALAIEMSHTQAGTDLGAVTAIVGTALDSTGVAADTEREPLPADPRILLASHQLRDLLIRLCWPRYDLTSPLLTRMISFYDATDEETSGATGLTGAASQSAHNSAMIATIAAYRNPEAVALAQELAGRQPTFRRGTTAALARLLPLGEMPDEVVAILIQLFDDTDDDIARLAGSVLMHLPAAHDELARHLLSAACQAKTFALEPSPVITAAEQYHGDISGSVIEIAERFFHLHGSQASDLRGSGGHAANVLGRLVIGIYAQETRNPQLTTRVLDLIDAMVLARTYGLEEHLAKLDR